jgi:hypothetical protein
MSQGLLLPYVVEVGARAATLTGRAGLPLVVETLRALGLEPVMEAAVQVRERGSGYTEVAKIEALVLLLAAGGDCLDDYRGVVPGRPMRVGAIAGAHAAGADTLRNFLYTFHDPALITAAQAQRAPGEVAYIPAENAALQGLGRVNVALVQRVAGQGRGTRATLDHDATVQESYKREAQVHYKGGRGVPALYWVGGIRWWPTSIATATCRREWPTSR